MAFYRRRLVMALAKVLIAAAWADHDLSTDEVNSLKQLLLRVPVGTGKEGALTAKEAAELDVYLHSPLDAGERARLIDDLREVIVTGNDRDVALAVLDEMVRADGVITPEERQVTEQVRAALASGGGLFSQLGRIFGLGSDPSRDGERREALTEEYLHNRVYFAVRMRSRNEALSDAGVDDTTLRRACLAAGVIATTIPAEHADTHELAVILRDSWHLGAHTAQIVAEAARSEAAKIDGFKLTNEFRTSADREQRLRLLDNLFAAAAAHGSVAPELNSAISAQVTAIGLTSSDFAQARARHS